MCSFSFVKHVSITVSFYLSINLLGSIHKGQQVVLVIIVGCAFGSGLGMVVETLEVQLIGPVVHCLCISSAVNIKVDDVIIITTALGARTATVPLCFGKQVESEASPASSLPLLAPPSRSLSSDISALALDTPVFLLRDGMVAAPASNRT